jgi:hypothetical protein
MTDTSYVWHAKGARELPAEALRAVRR